MTMSAIQKMKFHSRTLPLVQWIGDTQTIGPSTAPYDYPAENDSSDSISQTYSFQGPDPVSQIDEIYLGYGARLEYDDTLCAVMQ
jgi:hypothetical protein